MDRRTLLKLAASTAATAAFPIPVFAQGSLSYPSAFSQSGLDQSFSEDKLDAYVEALANQPFVAKMHVDEALAGVPYDKYEKAIVYNEEQAIWHDEAVPCRLKPYHTAGS